MPIGHSGDMSRHPPEVKIAILEFIDARLKDIVKKLYPERDANEVVRVYDPFTTKWDLYVWLDVDWCEYKKIYSMYFDTTFRGEKEKRFREYANEKILRHINRGDDDDVFNASTSKTEIFYTICEMKKIYGIDEETKAS